MSGFSISVQRPSRLHPSGSCVSSSEKLMNFMHFHNSCTQNCDYHVFLIMTGNAHKESCHKLSLILVRMQGLYIITTDCSGKTILLSQFKKKNLMVSLFCELVLPLFYLFLVNKSLIWLRYWSCFQHSDKSGYCSLYIQFHKL